MYQAVQSLDRVAWTSVPVKMRVKTANQPKHLRYQ